MSRTLFASLLLVLFGFGCQSVAQDIVAQDADITPGTPPAVIIAPAADGEVVSSPFTLSGFIHVDPDASYEWMINEGKMGMLTGEIHPGTPDANGYAPYVAQIFAPAGFPVCAGSPCAEGTESATEFRVEVRVAGGDFLGGRTLQWKESGKTSVSLFFVDEGDGDTCVASGYEKRTFAKTTQISELAMTELLKGSQKKMRTEIPDGTTLSQIVIEDGVAKVNFNSENESRWSGGSCHVGLIRSQITQTLMQIEGVTDVVITVNGKGDADGILQP